MMLLLYFFLIPVCASPLEIGSESCYHRNKTYVCQDKDDASQVHEVKRADECHLSNDSIRCSEVWTVYSLSTRGYGHPSLGLCLAGCHGNDTCAAVRMDSSGLCTHLEEDSVPRWSRDVEADMYLKNELNRGSLVCDEGCTAEVISHDQPCMTAGCAFCNNKDQCIHCRTGYYLTSNSTCSVSSVKCSVENCQMCLESDKCFVCNSGYHLDLNLSCRASPHIPTCIVDNCLSCMHESHCILCEPGYYLNDQSECFDMINMCNMNN